MRKVYCFILDCIAGIKNIFLWLPVIWKDGQWDWHYIFHLLQKKLYLMEQYFAGEHNLSYIGQDKDYKKIKLCRRLCDRIVRDEYEENAAIRFTGNELNSLLREAKHVEYMRKQDIKMLFEILNKNVENWWI